MATETLTTPRAKEKPARVESLQDAVGLFFRFPTPWIIASVMVFAWTLRIWLGSFTLWDVAIGAALVGFWPVQEWLIHVFILHFRPQKVLGHTVDLHVAEKHRAHHAAPWVLKDVFVPMRTLLTVLFFGLPLALGLWSLVLPFEIGLTGVAVFATFGLVYEWIHYLVHTGWKPRSRWYKTLWQHHRWHHFKNENYWYGVSRIEGDWLLKTAPDATEVESSPTARNLHGQENTTEA